MDNRRKESPSLYLSSFLFPRLPFLPCLSLPSLPPVSPPISPLFAPLLVPL